MKKIIAFLILMPFAATADHVKTDKSLEIFEKLCASSKDPLIRSTNCKLAENQRKAMIISKAQAIQ
ncbi:hypothetical protein [Legionella antarctica]|nr:hypothetical protein [Legionella antarctica]